MTQTKKIAFLGTGLMGAPMAMNLLKSGFQVACYNRTPSKAAPVIQAGGVLAASPQLAAENADIVISCVTDGPDVQRVYFGTQMQADGAAQGAKPNTLFVDMTTISPAISVEIGERLKSLGMRYLEAPITGGTIGAQNATLSILVGGEAVDLSDSQDALSALGQTITHCGPWGAGQGVKLCNQIMGAMNIWGVCEAFALARGMKIDPALLEKALAGGAASSWALKNLAPKIVAGDWAPGFMIDTQQKDMRLVLETAEKNLTTLPGSALVSQLWRSSQFHGDGADGVHALDKLFQRLCDN